jgi:DNA-binding MarR family transcriptional regulator
MLDKMSDASRIVERLRNKQLITREINFADKRSVSLRISKKGLDLLNKTDADVQKFDELLKALDSKEIKLLNKLLDKIRG